MKYSCLFFLAILPLAIFGCDPFSDDNLPPATVVLQSPPVGVNINLGEPFNLTAIIRTAYDLDSLVLTLDPIENRDHTIKYSQLLPIPVELISVEDNFAEATLNTSVLIETLPIDGYSAYYLSIVPYVKTDIRRRGLSSGSRAINFKE